jgi:hypothetical protein
METSQNYIMTRPIQCVFNQNDNLQVPSFLIESESTYGQVSLFVCFFFKAFRVKSLK